MALRSGELGREVLRGAAIGAFVGGAVWLASQGWGELSIGPGWFRIGGNGWFAGWPLPSWILMVGGGAVIGSIVGLIQCALARRRTTAMKQFAHELDLRYERDVAQTQLADGQELFAHWTVGGHGYHGR